MNYTTESRGIKTWAEEDRPREKLLNLGPAALTKAELLAILIGSGSKKLSAVELAKEVLSTYENDLHQLSRSGISDLTQHNGIGPAKAISIIAAMEISRRKQLQTAQTKPKIVSSADAFACFNDMADYTVEIFKVLLLNRQNAVIKIHTLSQGGVAGTVVDQKIIFKLALDHLASSIILCHNHPSGNLKPSQADIDITKKINAASKLLDIKILDHLIVSNQGYYSFADEGML